MQCEIFPNYFAQDPTSQLDVASSSQILVFSKSLNQIRISLMPEMKASRIALLPMYLSCDGFIIAAA